MISKKEHDNARVRILRRLALIASGGCFMAMGFYVGFGIYWGGVLAFYGCDYIQNIVAAKGAANPFMFVVLLVGVQGMMEFLVSGILGGIVARAVAKFLK